jgi:hypothetical protein
LTGTAGNSSSGGGSSGGGVALPGSQKWPSCSAVQTNPSGQVSISPDPQVGWQAPSRHALPAAHGVPLTQAVQPFDAFSQRTGLPAAAPRSAGAVHASGHLGRHLPSRQPPPSGQAAAIHSLHPLAAGRQVSCSPPAAHFVSLTAQLVGQAWHCPAWQSWPGWQGPLESHPVQPED